MSSAMNKEVRHFYFGADIVDPLVLRNRVLRAESEYDADVDAEKTALNYIESVSKCFDGNIYLLSASQDVVSPNKLRTKKGVLWQAKELRQLDCCSREIDVGDCKTRLVSLVNLDGFSYDSSELLVLNWVFSLIVLTTIDMNVLNSYIEGWVSKGGGSALAFNYDAVAKDLLSLDTTAILRYFPADNGQHEMLVTVGNREFVDENIQTCIESII